MMRVYTQAPVGSLIRKRGFGVLFQLEVLLPVPDIVILIRPLINMHPREKYKF